MAKMTGAQALIKSIRQNGVDTIFGLPGVQLDHLFDAMYHEGDALRLIHTRHEQGAAYMAFGYSQSTGRVGTCAGVPGPGLLNMSAALCTAHGCSAPVLCVTGQIPSPFIGKGYGMLHEIADQMGTMSSVTKWQGWADHPDDAPRLIRDAFEQLHTGRRRPVMVEMAPDVMGREADVELLDPIKVYSEPEPDPDLVEKAASLLGNAKCPGIFVGGGIYGAEEELFQVAEMLQAPVFMTQNGLGAVDWRHYLAQNMLVAARLWPKIDVALAVGTRFTMPMLDWGHDDEIKLIRIDPDPAQATDAWEPDVGIVATGKKALGVLAERTARHNRQRPSRKDELRGLKMEVTEELAEHLRPQHEYTMAIRKELPEDGIACLGVTQLGFYSWWSFPIYRPRTMIQPGYQGTLGYSFPTALGAKVGNPDKIVVCIVGDGGFMFNVQEMATAALHRINLVTILFNDNAFGNVRRTQKQLYGGRIIGSELKNPDFMKLADSFGVMGIRADSPETLGFALKEAFKADAPVLIEVRFREFPPWKKFHPIGKLR
ncbi:MAG: thiamine pyrophosphate-binding protein [Deltaproteobacteria bacterium]|nr:thiamine pyrophosphate-binding protein [Deltaproteobacteria bacterium]